MAADVIERKSDRTRQRLLDAARAEFSARGLEGARVEAIATRAGLNKQLIYRYFGNKDALYVRVLEDAYAQLRASDATLAAAGMPPGMALRHLVEQVFDRALAMRDVAALVADENVHQGRHVQDSPTIRALHQLLVERIGLLLRRGEAIGLFRAGIDPVHLFISILGLSTIYITNVHTLSAIFSRDLMQAEEIATWRAHIVDLVWHAVRRADDDAAP